MEMVENHGLSARYPNGWKACPAVVPSSWRISASNVRSGMAVRLPSETSRATLRIGGYEAGGHRLESPNTGARDDW